MKYTGKRGKKPCFAIVYCEACGDKSRNTTTAKNSVHCQGCLKEINAGEPIKFNHYHAKCLKVDSELREKKYTPIEIQFLSYCSVCLGFINGE